MKRSRFERHYSCMNAAYWSAAVVAATVVMLGFIVAVARRRQSYWWGPIAFIVTSCAGLALGSYFAVRIFMNVLDEMSRTGGGISAVQLGISQATQPMLAASWLALGITMLAGMFVLPFARKELTATAGARRPRAAIVALLTAFALAAGVTPVVLFQRATRFVLWAITPDAHVSTSEVVASRLLMTATVTACCFLILIALLVMTVRLARSSTSRPLFAITVFALAANFCISAVLITNLRSSSDRFRTAAFTGHYPPGSGSFANRCTPMHRKRDRVQREGWSRTTEGRARATERQARASEGRARATEGRVRATERRACATEGRACATEG